MMDAINPAVARRTLGYELRQARTGTGPTIEQVSGQLGWGSSKLLRIESGDVGVTRTDLRAILDELGVSAPEVRARLLALAEHSRRVPWSAFHDVAGNAMRRYLSGEGTASRIRAFEPVLVPDLLRAESYAWQVITALALPGTNAHKLKRRLDVWQARQAIFEHDDPPQLSFVLDEMVIHRLLSTTTGRDPVVTDQICRLYQAAENPRITLQILPLSVGLHVGLSGAFTLLTFAEADGMLYRPDRTRPVETGADQVALYDQVFSDLAARASPPEQARSILDDIVPSRTPAAHHHR